MDSQLLIFVAIGAGLLATELLYFRVALKFRIVDHPNDRSSHMRPVIRGGGVIFFVAIVFWFLQSGFSWPWFAAGTLIIAVVSFFDDIISLNPLVRFLVQLCAVLLLFAQLWPIHWPAYLLILAVVMCVGTLNAFNFMDGINGITGIYAMVTLVTFGYIQIYYQPFTDISLLIIMAIAVVIFLFFNFRVRARCFAGDVGSVTIAFVLIFILLQLIHVTHNLLWPLVFLVYGTDSIVTIVLRIRRRENIFTPHRAHLFQYLSNEMKWSHRQVALLFGGIQVMFNVIVVGSLVQRQVFLPVLATVVFFLVYVAVRGWVARQVKNSGASSDSVAA